MALVTVQRSPSPTNTPESETGEDDVDDPNNSKSPGRQRSFSESYFAVKGAALILPQSDSECTYSITRKISRNSNEGDIQSHLQSMFYLLRPQDTIKVAVKLESLKGGDRNRYMAVVSTNGKQDTEESVILGIDCDEKATIGLVVPIYANTTMKLDGDGGFQIIAEGHPFGFKPVSVQAMWSALQSLNKVLKIASDNMYLSRGLTHTWIGYYKSRINSERAYITEWNTNEDIEFFRAVPIVLETDDEEAALKKQIKVELKNVMMKVDLDDVTSRYLREQVEEVMGINLKEHRGFIDQQMLQILGQMDSPTLIKEFLYLGSEWNASNMAELQNNGVGYILNISKEIDNFFPAVFRYMNVREWDSEATDLLPYWEDTYKFIAEARANDSKVLVHCKMGISRSASTVIAFCMKEYDMSRQEAYDYVKDLRSCIMPNSAFWLQLETYDGILTASRQRRIFKVRSEQSMQKPPSKSTPETPVETMTFLGQNLPLFDYSHVCHSADLDESVFWHPDKRSDEDGNNDPCPLEPDFEISSRSADSTEELLPDNLSPPPDTASGLIKTASGVYYFKDPIMSKERTDSDESGEEVVDSGTDKNLLSLDIGKESACSLDVPSLPKIKPDRSWIRESSTDDLDPGGGSENVDQSKSDFMEGADTEDNAEEGVIYFKAGPSEVNEKSKSRDSVFLDDATVSESMTDDSPPGIDHYIKENIPWNPGKVKKQKADLEGKMKDSKSESVDSSDGVVILLDGIPLSDQASAEKSVNKPEVVKLLDQKNGDEKDDITLKENNTEKLLLDESPTGEQDPPLRRPASVYEIEDIQLPEGIVKRTTQEIEDRNRSTDDLTQSPNKPLRRSSSLKDERVTPKNKRSSERRKTCTPILSPSTPSDISPSKDLSKTELESSFIRDTTPHDLPVKSHDIDNTQSDDICDNKDRVFESDNPDSESPATDVAVYKFLGEEVPVEKGIVKKQKMDIEQKSRDRKESESKDSGTTAIRTETKSPTSENMSASTSALQSEYMVPASDIQNKLPVEGSIKSCDNVGKMISPHPDKSENYSDTCTNKHKQAYVIGDEFHESEKSEPVFELGAKSPSPKLKEREQKCVSPSSEKKESYCNAIQSTPVFSRKKQKSETEKLGRFDAETLELIREIGSALLNSPAKSELDEDEKDSQEGGGLVKRFVKNIEKQTRAVKKRQAREVIIIDKESQSQKKKPWKLNTPESHENLASLSSISVTSQSATETMPNSSMSCSTSTVTSLLGDKKSSGHESYIHEQTHKVPENTSAKGLTPFENKSSPKSPDSHVIDTQLTQSVISSSSQEVSGKSLLKDNQKKEEVKGVRTLVGKFESTDTPVVKTLSVLSPSEEIKNILSPQDVEIVSTTPIGQNSDKPLVKTPTGPHVLSDDQSSWEDMTSDSSTEGTAQLRHLRQNLRKTSYPSSRPKSAEHFYSRSSHAHYVPENRRSKFHHSRTMSENVDSCTPFSWEGKKIRKIHGKSHPLTKLETKRKGPFYNTM